MSIIFRQYQNDIIEKGSNILKNNNILYLAMEVRTGKTLVSLKIADLLNFKKVLFITKKKSIDTILSDYSKLKPNYEIVVINNESLHTVLDNDFDILISDEHHRLSSFPKQNKTFK